MRKWAQKRTSSWSSAGKQFIAIYCLKAAIFNKLIVFLKCNYCNKYNTIAIVLQCNILFPSTELEEHSALVLSST